METIKLMILNSSEEVLIKGSNCICYNAEYQPGDHIVVEIPVPGYYMIRLEDTLGEELVYFSKPTFSYAIPFAEGRIAYNPRSFTGAAHYLSARVATEAEVKQYQDLARNVYDCHGNESCFPHAFANVETRGESVFAARNAIDGVICPWSHGAYPFGSWGINRRSDAAWSLNFGREIIADKLVVYLRADFPHDAWWESARLTLSSGETRLLSFQKTGDGQIFDLNNVTITGLTLDELKKADDPSPFPALTQIQVLGRNM